MKKLILFIAILVYSISSFSQIWKEVREYTYTYYINNKPVISLDTNYLVNNINHTDVNIALYDSTGNYIDVINKVNKYKDRASYVYDFLKTNNGNVRIIIGLEEFWAPTIKSTKPTKREWWE